MKLRKLCRGEAMAGVGGLALLLITFGPWYALAGVQLSAWDELEIGRYLLILTAAVALLLPAAVATGRSGGQAVALAAARAGTVGLVCAIYVTYRLLARPDALNPAIGIFIGLASALLVLAGATLSIRDRAQAAPAT